MPEISINNLTKSSIDNDLVERVIKKVLKGEKVEGSVSIAFVGERRIRHLNDKYRGKNRVTDVLSFSGAEAEFKDFFKQDIGEIIICLKQVRKNAEQDKVSFKKELIHILIHGCLHLLGYDHKEPKQEEKMKAKEQKYLGAIYV